VRRDGARGKELPIVDMAVLIRRATLADERAAWDIIAEYSDAVDVYMRDEPADLRSYLEGPGALWLARADDDVAGCVVMRPLLRFGPRACEVKRLYVRPAYRGARIAGALMDALEAYAWSAGYDAAYLDSKDELQTAIRFYERRGYERIPRYNDNPEATVFMRRVLGDSGTGRTPS
jgi:GNAT superfamily N-acetyltransferase